MTDSKKDMLNYSSDEELDEKELFDSDEDEERDIKHIAEMVKEKQIRKMQDLKRMKEQDTAAFERMIYPNTGVSFLTKDTADKSIASVIYNYSDLYNLKIREFYSKLSSLYKNAEPYKNLIYYHYYLKYNNPIKYHKLYFDKLSEDQKRKLKEDGTIADVLKMEQYIADKGENWRSVTTDLVFPSLYKEFLSSLKEQNIYLRTDENIPLRAQVQLKDSDWVEGKYNEHLISLGEKIHARNMKKQLTEGAVAKLLNDYKNTKKTYENFLDNINKEYNNLDEFILKMGSVIKPPVEKKKIEKKEEPLTLQTFLVRMYLDNPNIEPKQIITKARTSLPKKIKIDPKKLIDSWNKVNEDTLLEEINFVIDDYISRKKGKIDEASIIEYISDKTNKPSSDLEYIKELIKQKIYKPVEKIEKVEVEEEGEESQDEIEEEEVPEEEEKEGEDYGEDIEEEVPEQEVEETEIPEQFNRGRQINVKDSEIYGAKITKLMKTIQIENEKIKVRKNLYKRFDQKTPYRTLSQMDNDYQTGAWIDNYKQTWIIPVTSDDDEKSKYIISSESIEHKKKIWYKPTKLWFILQCNSLSHKRVLNKHNLVCFYTDSKGEERTISFKVMYEDVFNKFTELDKEIFTAEELWKKSRKRPRALLDYYKDKILEKDEYGARKIAVIQLANVLSISSKNMMFPDDSTVIAGEIEQRVFNDNKGRTIDQYFMDISKIIVFIDPLRIGNYALKFRYKIHSKELNPSSINGKLSKNVMLSEIFDTDMPGKDEISQVIDRTVFEQRTTMFYDLISSIYNINITISSNTLDIGNMITCTNPNQPDDDTETLRYNDKGKLYCFSVHEMAEKIKNNDLVNQYTNNSFSTEFINYVTSLIGLVQPKETEKQKDTEEQKFDLIQEINDLLDEIENTCICGKTNDGQSIKSAVTKPNYNFREKMFCSMECVNNYDFDRD